MGLSLGDGGTPPVEAMAYCGLCPEEFIECAQAGPGYSVNVLVAELQVEAERAAKRHRWWVHYRWVWVRTLVGLFGGVFLGVTLTQLWGMLGLGLGLLIAGGVVYVIGRRNRRDLETFNEARRLQRQARDRTMRWEPRRDGKGRR